MLKVLHNLSMVFMYTAVVVAHDCLHNLSRFDVPSYVKFAPAIDTLLCGNYNGLLMLLSHKP